MFSSKVIAVPDQTLENTGHLIVAAIDGNRESSNSKLQHIGHEMEKTLIVVLAIFSASLASAQSLSLQNSTVRVTGTPGIIPLANSVIAGTPSKASTPNAENRCETTGTLTLRGKNQPFVCNAAKQWVAMNSGVTVVSTHLHVANLARISVPVCAAGQATWANAVPDETEPNGERAISYTLTRGGDSYVLHIDQLAGKTAHLTASVNTGCA